MTNRRCHTVLLAAASLSIPSPATATIREVIGGPGGTPFHIQCDTGEIMVGIRGNAGAYVDGLGILCAPPSSAARRVTGWAGGRGGMDQEIYCPVGASGLGVRMNFTRGGGLDRQYLNGVRIDCTSGATNCIETGEGCKRDVAGPSLFTQLATTSLQRCPSDERLVGLVGRAGQVVDAIGIICGPLPSVAQSAEPESWAGGARPQDPYAISESLVLGGRRNQPHPQWNVGGGSQVGMSGLCRSGFVWREASSDDRICVSPDARERARAENGLATSRIDAASAYGPQGCQSGYVWREAYPGDLACVPPASRERAGLENRVHYQNRQ